MTEFQMLEIAKKLGAKAQVGRHTSTQHVWATIDGYLLLISADEHDANSDEISFEALLRSRLEAAKACGNCSSPAAPVASPGG